MKRFKDADRLQHILDAISNIESFLLLTDQGTFLKSTKEQSAVCMQMTIIGEAAGKLSSGLCSRHAEIQWHKIISMRNVLVHDYVDTDFKLVWDTVQNDLPVFKAQITNILAELQPPRTVQEGMKKKI